MSMLKEFEAHLAEQKFVFEEVYGMKEMLTEDGEIINENVLKFISWAQNLLARPTVNQAQIARDPTVDAGEAPLDTVKDEADAWAKMAKTIAGLKYFMDKKIDGSDKNLIASKVGSDKKVEKYVKDFGLKQYKDVFDKVLADVQTKNKTYIKNLIGQIDKFYRVKNLQHAA